MKSSLIVDNYQELSELLSQERQGKRVVCTIGSWDILHRGHIEYLKKAKDLGDILVVGIDSDISYQRYKKKTPMYPQEDRQFILSAVRFIDYIALLQDVDEKGEWQMELVKSIKPDLFLCNFQSFSGEQRRRLEDICATEVVNFFSPQASSVIVAQEMKTIVLKEKEAKMSMRFYAFLLLSVLLSISILTTVGMVFLNAFKFTTLSEGILYLLIGKTVPEIFGMMYIVVKHLFPNKGA